MRRRARRDAALAAGEAPPSVPRPRPQISMAESTCKTRVVLDCAYDHIMSFKDICKLAHQVCSYLLNLTTSHINMLFQVSNCYSTNRHLSAPVQLYVTGLGSAFQGVGETKIEPAEQSTLARLRKVDAQNWDVNLKMVGDGLSTTYLLKLNMA